MEQYSTIMASLQDLEAAQSDERFDLKMVGHENPVGACYRDGSGTHQRGRGICSCPGDQSSFRSLAGREQKPALGFVVSHYDDEYAFRRAYEQTGDLVGATDCIEPAQRASYGWTQYPQDIIDEREPEDTMRMMLKAVMDTEAANEAAKAGEIFNISKGLVESLNAEAAYFVADDGQRSCLIVFDMQDSSQIPAIAEPLFQGAKAKITLSPCMNLDDLQKGLEQFQSNAT